MRALSKHIHFSFQLYIFPHFLLYKHAGNICRSQGYRLWVHYTGQHNPQYFLLSWLPWNRLSRTSSLDWVLYINPLFILWYYSYMHFFMLGGDIIRYWDSVHNIIIYRVSLFLIINCKKANNVSLMPRLSPCDT